MAVVGAVLWTVALLAASQSPQAPPPAAPPPAATALILGRVVDAASGRPVAGAIVTLSGGIVAQGFPSPGPGPRAMTNANGQFVFRKLQQAALTLTASKPGYAEGGYGRTRPGGSLATLRLNADERVSDVVIPMWHVGAIAGTVTDEAGEPLVGVWLRAFQSRYVAGHRRLLQSGSAYTDDRGAYRFGALTPGDYVVAFVSREASLPAPVVETLKFPAPANDPAAQALMRERIAVGASMGFPGTPSAIQVGNLVRQMNLDAPVPPPAAEAGPIFIYPTLFYPATPSAARATIIKVASGQERENVDLSLRPARASKVSGSVLGADGPVPNVALRLVPAAEDFETELETSVTMTGADGEFTLLGVPPGQYVIKVLRVPRPAMPAQPTMTQVQAGTSMFMSSSGAPPSPPPIPDDPTWFADTSVAVADGDVVGVVVPLQRGARLAGHLEFDGTRERPAPATLVRIVIAPEPANALSSGTPFTTIPPGRADETGAFKTYGVPPGRYTVRVLNTPAGWTLKSIVSEGRDLADTPFDLKAADVANVIVTFTDRPTKLSGVARGTGGNADADALVVVFPADNAAWADFGVTPRRLRSVRAGKDGSYSLTGLPPGEYYVAAIRDQAYAQWQDPQVLEDLSGLATQLRLADGEAKTQDLKTIGRRQ